MTTKMTDSIPPGNNSAHLLREFEQSQLRSIEILKQLLVTPADEDSGEPEAGHSEHQDSSSNSGESSSEAHYSSYPGKGVPNGGESIPETPDAQYWVMSTYATENSSTIIGLPPRQLGKRQRVFSLCASKKHYTGGLDYPLYWDESISLDQFLDRTTVSTTRTLWPTCYEALQRFRIQQYPECISVNHITHTIKCPPYFPDHSDPYLASDVDVRIVELDGQGTLCNCPETSTLVQDPAQYVISRSKTSRPFGRIISISCVTPTALGIATALYDLQEKGPYIPLLAKAPHHVAVRQAINEYMYWSHTDLLVNQLHAATCVQQFERQPTVSGGFCDVLSFQLTLPILNMRLGNDQTRYKDRVPWQGIWREFSPFSRLPKSYSRQDNRGPLVLGRFEPVLLRYAIVHGHRQPWQLFAIYTGWQPSLGTATGSSESTTAGGGLSPVSFLHSALESMLQQWESVIKAIDGQIDIPQKIIFNPHPLEDDPYDREELLFENEEFSLSRKYFWAQQTLRVCIDLVEGIVKELPETKALHRLESSSSDSNMDDQIAQLDGIINRFRGIITIMKQRQELVTSLSNGLFAASSVIEARLASKQNDNIRLLTLLTVGFLPISLITSVYSMQVLPSSATLASYFVVVVVTSSITFIIAFNAGIMNRMLHTAVKPIKQDARGYMMRDPTPEWSERGRKLAEKARMERVPAPVTDWWYFRYGFRRLMDGIGVKKWTRRRS